MTAGAQLRFAAMQAWPEGPRRLGTVLLDSEGRMTIEQAPPEHDGRLGQIIHTMNAAAVLHVQVPPGPGMSRYAIMSEKVPRTDPAFIPTLRNQLRLYYDVTLHPV